MPKTAAMRDQVNKFKQELILSKAIDLFYEQGYTGTTMAQIASELGVTKPFLYQRYQSKEDLLEEMFTRTEALSLASAQATIASSDTPERKLHKIVSQVVELGIDNHRLVSVFYSEERNLPPRKVARSKKLREQWQASLEKLLEEGRRKKVFSFGDVKLTIHVMLGGILWSYHWFPEYGVKSRDLVIREVTNAVLAIVGCPPQE